MKKYFLLLLFSSIFSVSAADYISSATERIEASEPVNGFLELKNWTAPRSDMTRFLRSNKILPQMELQFHEENGGLDKSWFPYIFGKNPLLNSIYFRLPQKDTALYNKYNAISCEIYPDIQNRASVWFEVSGSGVWTQACCPLKPRTWNRIVICWTNHTPEQARKIKKLVFSRQNFGLLPGDPKWSSYHLRNLRFEKIVTGTESGWAASEEKIILPQCGFAPGYYKRAVLSGKHPSDDFVVLKKGKIVLKGKLKKENHLTGSYKVAYFSELKESGTYVIRSGNLESVPFLISDDYMKHTAELNRNFLYSMRSGMATPAHPACFLDDCIRSDNRKQIDVTGGWFDASDLRGYHSMAMKTILRPLALSAYFNTPGLYDEALWGAKQLVKLYDTESGMPYTVHSLYPRNNPNKRMADLFKNGHFYKVNNYWTDNKPDSGDERVIHVAKGTYICHPDLQDSHWGMTAAGVWFTLFAREMKQDKALAEKVLALSKKHFDFMCDANTETLRKNGIGPFYPLHANALALRMECAVSLWRATGKTYYRELAFQIADLILSRQVRTVSTAKTGFFTGHFCDDSNRTVATMQRDNMYLGALIRLAQDFPQERISRRIIAALKIHSEYFLKRHEIYPLPYFMPFTQIRKKADKKNYSSEIATAPDGSKWYGTFQNSFLMGPLGGEAMDVLTLGIFMNDPVLQEYASGMLNYHLGDNPAGRGFIAACGTNYRHDIMSSALGWIPGMSSNPAIVNGIPTLPYSRHHGSNEIYTQTQALYAVCTSILAAPGKITFRFHGNLPTGKLQIFENGKCIRKVAITKKIIVELPGFHEYTFRFANGLQFKYMLLNGEKKEFALNMDRVIIPGKLKSPASVKKGDSVIFSLPVYAFGKNLKDVWFSLYAENIKLDKSSLKLDLVSGKESTLTFRGKALRDHEAFACVVRLKEDPKQFRSAAGVVR